MEIASIPVIHLLAYILLGVGGVGIGWPKLKQYLPVFKDKVEDTTIPVITPLSFAVTYSRDINEICKDPKITVFAVTNGLSTSQTTNLCDFVKGLTNE
jgi:hypothetical protein